MFAIRVEGGLKVLERGVLAACVPILSLYEIRGKAMMKCCFSYIILTLTLIQRPEYNSQLQNNTLNKYNYSFTRRHYTTKNTFHALVGDTICFQVTYIAALANVASIVVFSFM